MLKLESGRPRRYNRQMDEVTEVNGPLSLIRSRGFLDEPRTSLRMVARKSGVDIGVEMEQRREGRCGPSGSMTARAKV